MNIEQINKINLDQNYYYNSIKFLLENNKKMFSYNKCKQDIKQLIAFRDIDYLINCNAGYDKKVNY